MDILFKIKWLAMAVVLFSLGCAVRHEISVNIDPTFIAPGAEKAGKSAVSDAVIREIIQRNSTVEAVNEWIRESYSGFMIKGLADIDESDYEKYGEYLDSGSAYIIVHPAYHIFFSGSAVKFENSDIWDSKNIAERFLISPSLTAKDRLMKAQEKSIRDFLEYMSTDRKLIILVLPKDYRDYSSYKYRHDRDEYMRYINEVTNASPSVVYVYSSSPSRGGLDDDDNKRLFKMLFALRVKTVLVGGGFVGRCLDEFYTYFQRNYSENRLWMVPEISAFSPSDVSNSMAEDMVTTDGNVNTAEFAKAIRSKFVSNNELSPRLRPLVNNTGNGLSVRELAD